MHKPKPVVLLVELRWVSDVFPRGSKQRNFLDRFLYCSSSQQARLIHWQGVAATVPSLAWRRLAKLRWWLIRLIRRTKPER